MNKTISLGLISAAVVLAGTVTYFMSRNDPPKNATKNAPALSSPSTGHLELVQPGEQALPQAPIVPESPTEATKEFSRNMTGWFVQRSNHPTEDANKYPLFALADLSLLPPNPEKWISARRALLTSCAFDQQVPWAIRRNLIGFLLSTADADPGAIVPTVERLKWEAVRYNGIRDHDYADATRRLVRAIFKYKLNLNRADCLTQLSQTGWQVDKEELDYVFDQLLPKITVHQ